MQPVYENVMNTITKIKEKWIEGASRSWDMGEDYTSSTGTSINAVPVVLLPVVATVITVEFSRVSLQDAAERCIVRLAHVAPLCVASVLSYKKVTKGSEFLSRPPSPLNG